MDALRVTSQFDIGPITSGMKEASSAVETETAVMNEAFRTTVTNSERAFKKVEYGATESREAIRGLGEELGVRVPRHISSFLAELDGVGPLMAAAFTPIAVIGLVGVLREIPDALEKGINQLQGWNAAAKKAFEESTAEAIAFERHTIKLNEEIAKIALIGKSGPQKYALELQIAGSTTQELIGLQQQYKEKIDSTTASTEFLEKHSGVLSALGHGQVAVAEALALKFTGATKQIEQSKIQTEQWSKALKEINAEIEQRQKVEMPTIRAEGGVAAVQRAKQKAKAEEEAAKRAQEAWHRTVIAELDDADRLAKEKTRIAAQNAKEVADLDKYLAEKIKGLDKEIERDKERALGQAVETQRKALEKEDNDARKWQREQEERLRGITASFNREVLQWANGAQTFGRTMPGGLEGCCGQCDRELPKNGRSLSA